MAADLAESGEISSKMLKQLLDTCFEKSEDFPAVYEREKPQQISDTGAIELMIDEVIAVGDQNFQRKCQHELFERRSDRAIILASHSIETVRQLCTQALVLDRGVGTLYENVDQAIDVYNLL